MEGLQSTDETLLRAIAQRDEHAFATLYDRHAQTVYNLIMRIVRDRAIADEVLQDAFWQVWQKAGEFQGTGAAAGWIYRIARNKSLDQLRRQKARPQPMATTLADEEHNAFVSIAADANVELMAERALTRQHVRQALNGIPAEQRQCLELAYFEGMTQREIADYISVSVGTVKTRIRLGLEKLERSLRAAGLAAEDDTP